MKTTQGIDNRIREIVTYHGDEGTSGYLINEEKIQEIKTAIVDHLIAIAEGERKIIRKNRKADEKRYPTGWNACIDHLIARFRKELE